MAGRLLNLYTKLFGVWVMLFSLAAYVWPDAFLGLSRCQTWFFVLTMFGIGAVLDIDDFRQVARRPFIVFVGCVLQYGIVPVFALLVARGMRLPPELAVGLILTSAAPGAMSSGVMNYIAGADTAYSVSLTIVSTLASPLLTPLLTRFLAQEYLDVPFWPMMKDMLATVIAPLLAGLLLKYRYPASMKRVEPVFPAISVTFVIFICCWVVARNHDYFLKLTGAVFAAAVVLNVAGLAAGYGVGWISGMGWRQRRTLVIEGGMQNAGLGVILASRHFTPQTALPAALFVILCLVTASILVQTWRIVDDRAKRAALAAAVEDRA